MRRPGQPAAQPVHRHHRAEPARQQHVGEGEGRVQFDRRWHAGVPQAPLRALSDGPTLAATGPATPYVGTRRSRSWRPCRSCPPRTRKCDPIEPARAERQSQRQRSHDVESPEDRSGDPAERDEVHDSGHAGVEEVPVWQIGPVNEDGASECQAGMSKPEVEQWDAGGRQQGARLASRAPGRVGALNLRSDGTSHGCDCRILTDRRSRAGGRWATIRRGALGAARRPAATSASSSSTG